MRPYLDRIGYCHGKLTVVANVIPPMGNSNRGGTWLCKCECGKTKEIKGHRFGQKMPKSCGCATSEGKSMAAYSKRRYGEATINEQYRSHVNQCRKRKMTPLSKEIWKEMVLRPCQYCGTKDKRNITTNGSYTRRRVKPISLEEQRRYEVEMNGVDRIDSSKEYTPSNCISCCTMCNWLKSDYPLEDFLGHIKRVYEHSSLSSRC